VALKVLTIPTAPIEENCYIAYDEESKEALVIDPGNEGEKILSLLKGEDLKVQTILLTHGHWDHIGAVEELRRKLEVPVQIHGDDASMLTDSRQNLYAFMSGGRMEGEPADKVFREGAVFACGAYSFKVIHTPGHTPGGCCFYCQEAGVLFSGDSLFAEEIGRCDFPGGSLSSLVGSLKEKILCLPEETKVYPGHGPATRVGWERLHNPYLG
jgi:glyoxylase-like metal-dependent hydrolase (beta-lactamase superfamily II)